VPFGNSSLLLGSLWCGTMACWNPVQVIVSLVYQVARKLLSVPAVLLRRDVAKDAELLVLRHENAVLSRQLTGPRRYSPAERLLPTILVQELQRLMHQVVVEPIIEQRRMGPPKPVLAFLKHVPQVSYLPAYLIGVGFRPEHAPPSRAPSPSPGSVRARGRRNREGPWGTAAATTTPIRKSGNCQPALDLVA
jgi:hypothetical protein